MLVDQRTRRSVAFVCYEDDHGRRYPVGTAFFVDVAYGGHHREGPEIKWKRLRYAVTAKHLVTGRQRLFLRVRPRAVSPFFTDEPIDQERWTPHRAADVAVIPWEVPSDYHMGIDFQELASDKWVNGGEPTSREIDVGAWLYFLGLFATAVEAPDAGPSWSPAQPVARFGTLALMRGEKVPMAQGDVTTWHDSYLAEARSWGGQSGSPCFVYFQEGHDRAYQLASDPLNKRGFLPGFGKLLGLVSAHYDVRRPVAMTGDIGAIEATSRLNSGIAMITPAQYIVELLTQEEFGLVTDREKRTEKASRAPEGEATPDTADPETTTTAGLTRAGSTTGSAQSSTNEK